MYLDELIKNLKTVDFYLKNNVPKPTKYSIKKFIGKHDLPHYLSIRIGNGLEKLCRDMVNFFPQFELLPDTFLVKKQVDIAYVNHADKKIYYFEIKANIDHDSEKSAETSKKVAKIAQNLKNNYLYEGYDLNFGVFCPTNLNDTGLLYSRKPEIKLYSLKCFIETLTNKNYTLEDLQIIKALFIKKINQKLSKIK